jgi:hypothetical protein
VFWYEESVESFNNWDKQRVVYNLCCKGEEVFIDPFKKTPPLLAHLLRYDGDRTSKLFLKKIRLYNCLFAFTSMGAKVDRSLKSQKGPDYFKISGQVHHRIGSLLPAKDESVPPKYDRPKYAELYIYDTTNEVDNRIRALHPDGSTDSGLDEDIVGALIDMLNEHNSLVQQFRQARERLMGQTVEKISSGAVLGHCYNVKWLLLSGLHMVFAFVHFHAIVLTILAWNCACNGHYPGKNKSCLAAVVLVLSFSASKLMSVFSSWCRCMTG